MQYADVPEEQREQWVKDQGAPSALSKIITTGFKAIHLIYFFTAGADEVKCWQIRKASKAPQVHRLMMHVWQQAGGLATRGQGRGGGGGWRRGIISCCVPMAL